MRTSSSIRYRFIRRAVVAAAFVLAGQAALPASANANPRVEPQRKEAAVTSQLRATSLSTAKTSSSGWGALGGLATSDPAPVVSGTNLFVFITGGDAGVWYRELSSGTWSPWLPLGGLIISPVSSYADGSGVYVFGTGGDDALWYRRFVSGTWSPWLTLGGRVTSFAALTADGAGFDAFVLGGDDGVWYRNWSGSAWSGWQTLGGKAIADPTAASDPSGLYVIVIGTDGLAYFDYRTGGHWSGWTSMPGADWQSYPTAIGNGTFAFVTGSCISGVSCFNGAILSGALQNGAFLGFPPSPGSFFLSGMANTLLSNGGVRTFGVGGDFAMWFDDVDPGGPPASLGGLFISDPGAVTTPGGTIYVFGIGLDFGLWVDTM